MRFPALFTVTVLMAALPALAATSCPAPQVLVGTNCTLTAYLGWAIAGLGTDSVITLYAPPSLTGPLTIQPTALNSSLGTAYTGYLGIRVGQPGIPGSEIVTLSDMTPSVLAPGQMQQYVITQVCFDPTCTAAPPAGAVPNMFSMQIVISSANSADINPANETMLIARFLNGNQVLFEEQETALRTNSLYSVIPGINLGATPAGRYVFTGTAVNLPYEVLSVSNFNNPSPISGTVAIKDAQANIIAAAPIPPIPPGGAAGYLVIGRTPGDPLGLFPSSIVLPAGSDGIFHGILEVGMTGLIPGGFNIVMAQEFNGNTMLNLPVVHTNVP